MKLFLVENQVDCSILESTPDIEVSGSFKEYYGERIHDQCTVSTMSYK